jgi:hypothetical protein
MKPRDDARRKSSRDQLRDLQAANERTAQRTRVLARKLAANSHGKKEGEQWPASTAERPFASTPVLPPVRLYHRSDRETQIQLVAAAKDAVAAVAEALVSRDSRVILTWPDKLNRPLALTIAALLRAQSAAPQLQATVAYFPFSDRSMVGVRSIFLDENDIAARYHKVVVDMERAEYGSAAYKYAYLLKGLKSAPKAGLLGAPARGAGSRPTLREMLAIFPPWGAGHVDQYAASDPGFLGEISSKRTLIREASGFRNELARADVAPIAIFGLPQDVDDINRCFRSGSRLSDRCDLILADATNVEFGEGATWLKRFRRLRHIAVNHKSRPAVVVLTCDPFIAKVAADILNAPTDHQQAPKQARQASICTYIKIIPNDFSSQASGPASWKPVEVSIYLKEQRLTDFRSDGLALAADLRIAGYRNAADAVMDGVTYVRSIACLPVGLDVVRKHLDAMEEAGAVSWFVAAPYRHLHVSALLKRAAEQADSLGDRILQFRETVADMTTLYSAGSEVTELMREFVERATRKANRTIIAFRDRVILHAFDSWLYEREDIDHEKLAHKILLTTTDALGSTLSTAARGAPIDTLLLVHPKAKHFRRIIMSPALPKKLALVGDAGSVGALHGMVSVVAPVLSGEPAQRVAAVLAALKECRAQFGSFDFEMVIAPEFKPETTLDFTVQDTADQAYSGPVVELLTDDGYRLRLLPHADCLIRHDDDIVPLKMVRASDVKPDDRIFVFTQDVHDRLESLVGPVQVEGLTLLQSYHQAVRDRVALIPGPRQEQAREIVKRMRDAATQRGETAQLGAHETANVTRWMSAGRTGGRPDAPRSARTFGYFMDALEVPETIAAQYWHNAVVSTRVLAIQAGLHAHGRAQEFVLNPQGFYTRYAEAKPELRQLWEEMVRSASVVVDARTVRPERVLENVR